MADDNQDIFGKIDALLEKRAGFGTREGHRQPDDDFPLLTEVVKPQTDKPSLEDRRQSDRRLGTDRRQGERRKETLGRPETPRATLSDEQFNRFLAQFEQKLEDLFIRQQLRIEETIRRALQNRADDAGGAPPKPL
ncbi:MAG: hypothetical protein ACUVT2_03960 [Thiobacillaceae bacterium]